MRATSFSKRASEVGYTIFSGQLPPEAGDSNRTHSVARNRFVQGYQDRAVK